MTRNELLKQIDEEVKRCIPANCVLDADHLTTVEAVVEKVIEDAPAIMDASEDDEEAEGVGDTDETGSEIEEEPQTDKEMQG